MLRRPNAVHQQVSTLPIDPPIELAPEAHGYWRRDIAPMIAKGKLENEDYSLCLDYCWYVCQQEKLKIEAEEDGPTLINKNKDKQRNPVWLTLQNTTKVVMECRVQLGMTPYARKKREDRKKGKQDDEDNPLLEGYEIR